MLIFALWNLRMAKILVVARLQVEEIKVAYHASERKTRLREPEETSEEWDRTCHCAKDRYRVRCQLLSAYSVRPVTIGGQQTSKLRLERHDRPIPSCFSLVQSVPGFLTRLHDNYLTNTIRRCQQNFAFIVSLRKRLIKIVPKFSIWSWSIIRLSSSDIARLENYP